MRLIGYSICLLLMSTAALSQPSSAISVHDPVMIKQDSIYYLFCTGVGITVWSSPDLKAWKKEAPVFAKPPQWALAEIAGFKDHIWAPDISYHNGLYYLYYAVSAFGKNTSCIGLAVNKTLNPSSPDFHWEDKGKVIESVPGRDMWNAIDPNLIIDEQQHAWLSFGSFWNGIKLVALNDSLNALAEPQRWYTIASRKRSFGLSDSLAGDAAIEAPFIFRKNEFYYLFVSFDYCCRGEKSTYKMMVGRSNKVYGPYIDKEGKALAEGGGSLVLQGNTKWHGVGHNAVIKVNADDYLVFHAYDAADNGKSKLRMEKIDWVDGWPEVHPVDQ